MIKRNSACRRLLSKWEWLFKTFSSLWTGGIKKDDLESSGAQVWRPLP